MVKLALFIVTILAISSCGEKSESVATTEHKFFYSDGTQITDSLTIKAVSIEVDSILSMGTKDKFKIFTGLSSINFIDPISLDTIRNGMRTALLNKNPEFRKEIAQIPKDWLLNVGILIIDNETGRMISYQNASDTLDIIAPYRLHGPSNRIYGILMALEKGFGVNDDYVHEVVSNGKTSELRYSLKRLFGGTFGVIPKYPYHNYTYAEWRNLDRQFRWNLEITATKHKDYPVWNYTNMISMVRTVATFKNGGIYKMESPLDYVNNGKGQSVFQKQRIIEKVISDTTNSKMLHMFDYAKNEGFVKLTATRLGIGEEDILYFSECTDKFDWLLYANERYTVGIITSNAHGFLNEQKKFKRLRMFGYQWRSPRQCIPFLEYVLMKLEEK